MAQKRPGGSLALMLLLLVGHVGAAPRQHRPQVTGAELVRDMLADPFADDANNIRRERAMGYIDGVMDAGAGLQWCPAGKAVPHELNYLVIEEISSMPAAKLNGNAATLVLGALARQFPCKIT